MASAAARKPFYRILYVQVLIGIAIGVLLGEFWPHIAIDMKPLGDGFIKLIKMVISLIVFCTVVTGIAGMNDMKKVGMKTPSAPGRGARGWEKDGKGVPPVSRVRVRWRPSVGPVAPTC